MIDRKYIIHETPGWTWSLFPNQSYLGRVQLTLRRECHGSLASLSDEEWLDLRRNLQTYEQIMGDLFRPDRFNYEQLGNVWPQVHVHAIPRYASPRTWNGVAFEDTRWGNLPMPEPDSPIGEPETLRLVDVFRETMRSTR